MRIVHWVDLRPGVVSGLLMQTREQILNERKMGIDNVVMNPSSIDGGGDIDGIKIMPHSAVDDKDIHVIHSAAPPRYDSYAKKIFLIHGTPEYAFGGENLATMRNSFSTAMTLIHDCDISVTMHKRHLSYWQEFADNDRGKVRFVPSGVDVEKWVRPGRYVDMKMHPMISYMDIGRDVKSPFQVLFSVKKAYLHDVRIRFSLWAVPPDEQMMWVKMISKMNMDKIVVNFRVNPVSEPDAIYRGSDMLVSNCRFGDITRVAMEAMSCGVPTLIPRGDYMASGYYKEGDVDDLAKQIIRLVEKYDANKEGMRNSAREIAVKHYDIKNTVSAMKKIYDELES